MNIFVTGASGFIGQHLAERLAKGGHEVSILLRNPENAKLFKGLKLKIYYGNLDSGDILEKACKNVHYVFHLAGVIHPVSVPDSFYWNANVKGTENVIKAALKSKSLKKFIYCGSVSCFGKVKKQNKTILNEDSPCNPANIYGKTKYQGEKVVESYAQKGLKYIIIRPERVYGPGDKTFIPIFRLVKKQFFSCIGLKKQYMMPVYIDDLISAFIACINAKKTNRIYNITGPAWIDQKKFMESIASSMGITAGKIRMPLLPLLIGAVGCEAIFKLLHKEPALSRKKLRFFRISRRYNIQKAKKELGYCPKVNIEEGIEKTAEWYKENGFI